MFAATKARKMGDFIVFGVWGRTLLRVDSWESKRLLVR